jgi:PmbA protein
MLDKSHAMELLQAALKKSQAAQTEAVLLGEQIWLTRFAESVIHQNMGIEDTRLVISAVTDKKFGMASTNDLSETGIKEVVETANKICQLSKPDERFESFPDPKIAPPLEKSTTAEPNLNYSPKEMADAVSGAIKACGKNNLDASGAFRHDINMVAVANSLGVAQYGRFGKGEFSMTVTGQGDSSGYSIAYDPNPAKIDIAAAADRAIKKALTNITPVSLPDGQYTVILEPAAVGQLLLFLGFLGFGGKTMTQHRSFMSDKKGQPITSPAITITDEPTDPIFGGLLFDYEGVTRQRLVCIDHGNAGDAAYDSYYANIAKVPPTGHALPPDNSFGPYPRNLAMAGGDSTLADMIASTDKGVLITHFWYINYLNPMKTMVTGTTRDGTYLVEGGKITSALNNMRANQSILEALTNVETISKERLIYPQYSSLMLVPALKVKNFNLAAETKAGWEGKC